MSMTQVNVMVTGYEGLLFREGFSEEAPFDQTMEVEKRAREVAQGSKVNEARAKGTGERYTLCVQRGE